MVSNEFATLWESVIEHLRTIADDLKIDPTQIVPGIYSQMTITAPAIVVYLEPYDVLVNEASQPIEDRATCICFLLVESAGAEWQTASRGVDMARHALNSLYGDFDYIGVGNNPIKIDDVFETHAVITITFTLSL